MGRLLVISDIHGCLNEFNKLIDKVDLTKEDKLVILGDVIDRGPSNIETAFKIMELKRNEYNIINIMGNHEEMFLHTIQACKSIEELWESKYFNILKSNGTLSTLIEYFNLNDQDKMKVRLELSGYRKYYKVDNFLFTHAGVLPNVELKNQTTDDLMWIREGFIDEEIHGLPYTVIFGHTPTRQLHSDGEDKIWYGEDKIGIDCACVFGGNLACLDLTNNKEYYVGRE